MPVFLQTHDTIKTRQKSKCIRPAISAPGLSLQGNKANPMFLLQRTVGNQAVQRIVQTARRQFPTNPVTCGFPNRRVVQRAVECDELGQCQSVPDPPNAASLLPPGDCLPVEHRMLQNEVNWACKERRRRCHIADDCATIWQKIEANAECIRARSTINSRCFRGGDVGHNQAIMAAVGALNNCWRIYDRTCRSRTPPVPPVRVPQPARKHRPEVDRSFMERMAAITGLTGTALVIYLIISEGSRLFPPRNLVPVP